MWALSVAVRALDLLKEVIIIFITSTIVWPQVNNRKATQLHWSTKNWIRDLLSMALGEGNGTPLQYSCLEDPRDRGAWWAAVYGVAQSRT